MCVALFAGSPATGCIGLLPRDPTQTAQHLSKVHNSLYAKALTALKIAGGLYLLWLAWRAARSAAAANRPADGAAGVSPSAWQLYRRGVLMHLGNPKAVLAWIAIMSLGLKPGAPHEMVAVAFGGCALLGVAIFSGYALLFSTEPMVRAYARGRRWIEGVLAVVFASAGIRLLLVP